MNAFEYSKSVINCCSEYEFIDEVEIILLDEPVVKLNATVGKELFISVFYNAATLKYSFTLIKKGKRIFGIDNVRSWHIHPFDNPEFHIETEETTFSQFLELLYENKHKWK